MRLRSVRMKSGGAAVRVLHTELPHNNDGNDENWRGTMIAAAKRIGSFGEPGSELDGYIVLGMFSDGTTSMGVRLSQRIPRALLPSYIAEVLRRDVITEREAEIVFDNKFEWVE